MKALTIVLLVGIFLQLTAVNINLSKTNDTVRQVNRYQAVPRLSTEYP